MSDDDRQMFRCDNCDTTTAQSRACPFCNSKSLSEVTADGT